MLPLGNKPIINRYFIYRAEPERNNFVNALLVEANWKKNGLAKRTDAEKKKLKKTGISEALREYAKVAAGKVVDEPACKAKEDALKAILAALKIAKTNATGNTALLKVLADMEKAVKDEAEDHNDAVAKLSMQTIGTVPGGKEALTDGAQKSAFADELGFYRDAVAGKPPTELYRKWVAPNPRSRSRWSSISPRCRRRRAARDLLARTAPPPHADQVSVRDLGGGEYGPPWQAGSKGFAGSRSIAGPFGTMSRPANLAKQLPCS